MATLHLRQWTSNFLVCRYALSSPARQARPKLLDRQFFSHSTLQLSRTHSIAPKFQLLSLLSDSCQSKSSSISSNTLWTRWYRSKHDALTTRARLAAQRSRRSSVGGGGGPNPFSTWFNNLPTNVLVWGILGLNGAVYFAWQYASDQARAGNPSLFVALYKNVTLSWRNIREGRIWTIITSTFSHSSTSHFLLNALTFYFMAPPVVQILGNTAFMSLYFLGGVSCSALSLLLNQSVSKRDGASNGASGAIYAVISYFACVAPNTKFLVFFVLPVPAWAVVTGFFVWDGLSALTDRRTTIDGAGHVGGILAGAAYWFFKARYRY